jgi:hypothetical protein
LVLDLVDTVAIDAAGLGVLVSVRAWAKQTNRGLKLMNVPPRVEQLLQLTNLKSSFEVCSAEEMLDLLCCAIHEGESSRLQPVLRDGNAVDQTLGERTAVSA